MEPSPSDASRPLEVRVPCSTSNLGPGFDCLGLALSLWLEVRAHPAASTGLGQLSGEAEGWRDHEPDLLVEAYRRAGELTQVSGALRFDVHSEIPEGRGFGSSGTAVAAGLLLARATGRKSVSLEELLAIGIELEGHPDNVTASLLGGATLCHAWTEGGPTVLPITPASDVAWALAWPAEPLSTRDARRVLPKSVPFEDAAENPRRLALLLEGLRTGSRELLEKGAADRLHVPYRLALLPGARDALAAATEAGAWLATISGAGSGLVAASSFDRIADVAEALRVSLSERTGWAEARVVEPVLGSPEVRPLEAT